MTVPLPPPSTPARHGPPPAGGRVWAFRALILALALCLVAAAVTGAVAVRQSNELDRQSAEIERLRADLAETERELEEVREAADSDAGGGISGMLEQFFGGDGELSGGFGDLLGRDAGALADCLGASGGLDGLLDGELDGLVGGDLDGLLDGLLDGQLEGLLGRDVEGLVGSELDRLLDGGLEDQVSRGLGGLLDSGLEDAAADLGLGGSDQAQTGSATTVEDQVEEIAAAVEELRGLQFREPVEPVLRGHEAFVDDLTERVAEEYTAADADVDGRLLTALGAVEEGTDLREVRLELVGEGAGGFYDSDTGEIFVRVDDEDAPLSPAERVILAHELEHALTDQHAGLPLDTEEAAARADSARAALALVEGGATLSMQQYASSALGLDEQLAMAADPTILAQQEQLAAYPPWLQQELLFPYEEGLKFACDLYADGGWPAIDEAYERLPTTTAQILFPERYEAQEAAEDPAVPRDPGSGWQRRHRGEFGAAELLWLLSAPGGDETAALGEPRRRVEAWAGGRVAVWADGADSAVGLVLIDRDGDGGLCATLAEWHAAAFPAATVRPTSGDEERVATGDGLDAVVTCPADEVRLGLAPDLDTARAIAGG